MLHEAHSGLAVFRTMIAAQIGQLEQCRPKYIYSISYKVQHLSRWTRIYCGYLNLNLFISY